MSQEHAERGEIGICQIGQDFAVEGIIAKCLLVLFQPEATQKGRDVHARRPPTNPALLARVCGAAHCVSSASRRRGLAAIGSASGA